MMGMGNTPVIYIWQVEVYDDCIALGSPFHSLCASNQFESIRPEYNIKMVLERMVKGHGLN
jgi:hypothetical protein